MPAESRMLLATKASGKSRNLRRVMMLLSVSRFTCVTELKNRYLAPPHRCGEFRRA